VNKIKKVRKFKKDTYAVVDGCFDKDWNYNFRWADSVSRTFYGKFKTVDDAVNSIPRYIKKIVINYADNDGKEINYEINRN
jgi:hypothetical protein